MSVSEEQQIKVLSSGLAYANRYINRQYLANVDVHRVETFDGDYKAVRLFRITKLVYDSNENTMDKLISVYGALNSIQSTALIIIKSRKTTVEVYMGVRCLKASTASSILKDSMIGNFGGSEIESLTEGEIIDVMAGKYRDPHNVMNISSVTLVPSLRDEEKEKYVQGLEKLIDSMKGREYTAYYIAEPMDSRAIEEKKRGLEHLYATISPYSETSLTYGKNTSRAVAEGTFTSFSTSINESVSNSTSQSEFRSHADGTSSSFGFNSGSRDGDSSSGSSANFGSSSTDSYGSSQAWSNAVTQGRADTDSSGTNYTVTDTISNSRTISIKHINKSVKELMDHIDRQLERIRECESFGLWSAAAYFVSEDVQTTVVGASGLRALLAGDDTQIDRTFVNTWDASNGNHNVAGIFNSISKGIHPLIHLPRENQYKDQTVKPTVLVSGKELPLFLSLPNYSVPGLVVDRMASFGRAVFVTDQNSHDSQKIGLGRVMHKGIVEEVPVELEVEEFRSHCFITGSTGSGKSNTTYHLISSFFKTGKAIPCNRTGKRGIQICFRWC